MKRANDYIISVIVALLLMSSIFGIYKTVSRMWGVPEDSPLEEHLESIVEDRLGLPEGSFDLTPETLEN